MPLIRKDQYTTNGIYTTRGMFVEFVPEGNRTTKPVFTLEDEDRGEYLSFPRLYREYTVDDPTEFEFAMAVFGSVKYWEALSKQSDLQPKLEELRLENRLRLKAQTVKQIIKEAANSKSPFQAQKFLYQNDFIEGKKPSKTLKQKMDEDIKSNLSKDPDVLEDAKRLGLRLVGE